MTAAISKRYDLLSPRRQPPCPTLVCLILRSTDIKHLQQLPHIPVGMCELDAQMSCAPPDKQAGSSRVLGIKAHMHTAEASSSAFADRWHQNEQWPRSSWSSYGAHCGCSALLGATCNFLANVSLADGSGGLQSWRRNPSRGCQRLEAKNETCSCFLGPSVVLRMSDGTPEAELTCMVHHACAGSSAFQVAY